MKKILLLASLLLVSCAPSRVVHLSAQTAPMENFAVKQCDIAYADSNEKSITGKRIASGILRKLENNGIEIVEKSDQCHIVAKWGAETEEYHYTVPLYGQTGMYSSVRHDRRGRHYFEYVPTYGVTGYAPATDWYTAKFIEISATNEKAEEMFNVVVKSGGKSSLEEGLDDLLCGVNYALFTNYAGSILEIPDALDEPEEYGRICNSGKYR